MPETASHRVRLSAEQKLGNAHSSHVHLLVNLQVETYDGQADRRIVEEHFLGCLIVPAGYADRVKLLLEAAWEKADEQRD